MESVKQRVAWYLGIRARRIALRPRPLLARRLAIKRNQEVDQKTCGHGVSRELGNTPT
jgi:hypothetical protein